ncbi:unnamed protein product [Sphagnum balticum]
MELSKSKNRKVERFALCQTDFTSAYCVTFSNGRKFRRGEQQLQQHVSPGGTLKTGRITDGMLRRILPTAGAGA